jgi:UDP:flavonoid glycosyltransferase YjiC (YdhE family)
VGTVVLASELGGGMGHVAKLLTVGRALRAFGHRLVLASSGMPDAPGLFDEEVEIVPAPVARARPPRGSRPRRAVSYADVLDDAGYGDDRALAGLVEEWHRLLARSAAALVVADHAPAACLAAHGTIPSVVIGTGFTVPPVNGRCFPPLEPIAESAAREEHLHAVISRVFQARRQSVPATLPAAVAGSARFPCCSPELDPYDARSSPVAGPLNALPPSAPPSVPRFFAYLAAGPLLEPLVTALAESGVPGDLFVRGVPFLAALLAGSRVTVHDRPPAAAEVVPHATVVVHHGGTLSEAALSAGRPQLLAPVYLEQELTARALVRLGVGVVAPMPVSADGIAAVVTATAASGCLMARAQDLAGAVAARALQPLPAVVAACLDLLAGRDPAPGAIGASSA